LSGEGHGRSALVTGASSGIGRAFAELLASRGFDLVLTARREQRLRALEEELSRRHGISVAVVPEDLADPRACDRIIAALDGRPIDFLVNNAGYTLYGRYLDLSWEEQRAMLQVMGVAVCELTHRLLGSMVERGYGRIVNVASAGGFFPGSPQYTLYAPLKALEIALAEGIDAEYRPRGVHATASAPGFTETEILDSSPALREAAHSRFGRLTMQSPETVARQAYDAVMEGRRLVVHGWWAKLLSQYLRRAPRAWAYRFVASAYTE
jgi:short-subunit dehydrogenase